jgi:hypothetical protein
MATKAGRDEALILSLARGLNVRAAAKASGYSERQTHRKLAEPVFRRRVSEARGAIVGRAVGMLSAAGTEAARTLKKSLKSETDLVRLSAARSILELGNKLRETAELTERIEALEALQERQGQQAGNSQPMKIFNRGAK